MLPAPASGRFSLRFQLRFALQPGPQRRKTGRQTPVTEGPTVIERAGLSLERGQVMQRIQRLLMLLP